MKPVLFHIGSIPIFGYGVMLSIAFGVGVILALKEARRKGLKEEDVFDVSLYCLLAGIVGSRLFYILINLDYYMKFPGKILAFREGGLAFQGGLIATIIVVFFIVKRRGISLGKLADALTPSLALGMAIGRIGCFLNGCCYGVICHMPWGVNFFDVPRHPTQIYESFLDVVMFLILWKKRKKIIYNGYLFTLYLIIYAFIRFIVEFWRDSIRILGPLSVFQLVSIFLGISGIILLMRNLRQNTSQLREELQDESQQQEGI